ncbi:MAG: class I SAM-dependent DNA methyltransferase [Phototrophicaceae bacterium]
MPAFDAFAPTYDRDFTHSPIAWGLRQRAQTRLELYFNHSQTILELGCGTGEDAASLAMRGVNVIATDASPAMLEVARAKANGLPIQFATLDLTNLPDTEFLGQVDGVLANFGVLNVLAEWETLAAWLAARVRAGGVVAFAVMSPYCVWELLWHGLHGDFATATRRWRHAAHFQASADSPPILIYYPRPRRLIADFSPYFTPVHLAPLGIALPPSDVYGVIEKRPRLLQRLTALDETLSAYPLLAPLADHYWIELQRTDVPAP